MTDLRYFSMFSGIGGFEVGIQRAMPTARCVGFSEVDRHAASVYQRHFKEHHNYGDATQLDPRRISEFELLVAGFPCQAFSQAGQRRGFADPRGTLFFEIARLLAHKRPRHLVLENVKGLLSHAGGETFQTILGVLADLGYRVEWQVLDSQKFDTPQQRNRVYLVGHLAGECRRQVLPLRSTRRLPPDAGRHAKCGAESFIATRRLGGNGRLTTRICPALLASDIPGVVEPGATTCSGTSSRCREHGADPRPTASGCSAGSRAQQAASNCRQTPQRRIRRLTPLECERLQGFPDDWTRWGADGAEISDHQRYRMCGNAVTTTVVTALISSMDGCLS